MRTTTLPRKTNEPPESYAPENIVKLRFWMLLVSAMASLFPCRALAQGLPDASLPLPSFLHFCGANCFHLQLVQGHYLARPDNDLGGGNPTATYSAQKFTMESVILVRVENGGQRAVVSGKISTNGFELIHCQIHWITLYNGATYPCKLAWGGLESNAQPIISAPITLPQPPVTEFTSGVSASGSGASRFGAASSDETNLETKLDTKLLAPVGLVADQNELFIADSGQPSGSPAYFPQVSRILAVNPQTGKTRILLDGVTPRRESSPLGYAPPESLASDEQGYLYVRVASTILRINKKTGTYTTITVKPSEEAATGSGNVVFADAADHYIGAMGVDATGNIYTGGSDGILKRSNDGQVTRLADPGALPQPRRGEGPAYSSAGDVTIFFAVDRVGNLYYGSPADRDGVQHTMMRSAATGQTTQIINTIPYGVGGAVDSSGNFYSDSGGGEGKSVIAHVSAAPVPTAAAVVNTSDRCPVALDGSGNLYVLGPDFIQKFPVVHR